MTGSTDELPEPGTRRLLIIPHQLRGRPRGQLHDKPAAYSELMLPTTSYQAPQQLIALDPKALSALSEDEARGIVEGLGGMLQVVQDGVLPANFRGCRVC